MRALIALLVSPASDNTGTTERELVAAALTATKEVSLLDTFATSPALERLKEWLEQDEAPSRQTAMLSLLDHLPMKVTALTRTGVGKTVR